MAASWKRLVTADEISSFTSNTGTVTGITPGTGLKNGDDNDNAITASGTLVLDLAELTDMTGAASATTEMVVVDNGDNGKRKALSEIGLEQFDNSTSGFTTNTGTVTSVTVDGGTNLTDSGGPITSGAGTITMNLDTSLTAMVSMAAVDQAAGTEDADGGDLTFKGGISTGTGAGGSIKFQVSADPQAASSTTQNALADALTIASGATNGSDSTVTIHGDLIVNGSTSSVDVQTLTVEDKTILVADGAANNTAASGGGIIVDTAAGTTDRAHLQWMDSEVGVTGWSLKEDGAAASYPQMGVAVMNKKTTANAPNDSNMPTGALYYVSHATGRGLYVYHD